jgi:hypothetical protein
VGRGREEDTHSPPRFYQGHPDLIGTGVFIVKNIDIEDKLFSFIKDFGDDLNSLELLLFFSRHPHARFNRTAVIHAITSQQFDTGIALKRLTDKKIVVTVFENGITLFALTKEEPMHSLAAQMNEIDQRQWQIILEHLLDAQGIE